MVSANVFGLGSSAVIGQGTATGQFLMSTSYVCAIARGLIEAFSGPLNEVAEAAINFDNPEYKADILLVVYWEKFSPKIQMQLLSCQQVSVICLSAEEAFGINIGGELFLDVGTTRESSLWLCRWLRWTWYLLM